MTPAETLRRLERLETLIRERPKFWQNHAIGEINRLKESVSAASSDEPSCHIGIGKGESHE